jgi:hypothetical protein
MKDWDDSYYRLEAPERVVISGLCIKCPEGSEVKATHKYNQLQRMCKKHYDEVVLIVKSICQ